MGLWDWDLTRTIAALSFVMALLGLIISSLSLIISWRNRQLAIAQDRRKQPGLTIKSDSNKVSRSPQGVIYLCCANFINNSENSDSITAAELVIDMPRLENGATPILRLPPNLLDKNTGQKSDFQATSLPLNIPPNSTARACFGYQVGSNISEDRLLGFHLEITDRLGNPHRLNSLIFVEERYV